jgi:hypothetical protein
MRRLSGILKFCFAWPIVHAIDMISYIRAQEGWAERISAALVMLPGYVISTLFWLLVWALALAEVFDFG